MKVLRVVRIREQSTDGLSANRNKEYQTLSDAVIGRKAALLDHIPGLENFDLRNMAQAMLLSELNVKITDMACRMVEKEWGISKVEAVFTSRSEQQKIRRVWNKFLKFLRIQEYYESGENASFLGSWYRFELTFENEAAHTAYLLKYGE